MNQTMDIMSGILNISTFTLEVPTADCQSLLAAFCIHANSSIKSTVTSDIITWLARVSLGHA